MPKKKKDADIGVDFPAVVEDLTPTPAQPVYFETVMWKGVKEVLKCSTCGTCRDDVEAMIFHVVNHVPQAQRNDLFDELIALYKV